MGAAPLQVTLTATGDAAAYHWDLGDGTTADGPTVQHVYAAGAFTARVTATASTGETAQAAVAVTSIGLSLAAPRVGRYQQKLRFHGRLAPARKGVRVGLFRGERRIASVRTGKDGRFFVRGRVGIPDQRYTVRYAGAVSNAVSLAVRPGLDTAFLGSGQLGRRLSFLARVRPAVAGTLTRSDLARNAARESAQRSRSNPHRPQHGSCRRLSSPCLAAAGARVPPGAPSPRAHRLPPLPVRRLAPARASTSSTAGSASSITHSVRSTATSDATTWTP